MAQHATPQLSAPASQESGKHLVLALLIAAVIVTGARLLADHLIHPATTTVAAQTSLSVTPVADTSAEDARIAAEDRAARQAREQTIIEEDRALREKKKAEAMRTRDEAVATAQAEEVRKDAAWQHFFTRSKKCDSPADDATRVDCSNQYIRAQERFEKLYADGKLR